MDTCPKCAVPVGAADEFCTSCGAALRGPSAAPTAPLQPTTPAQPTPSAYPPSAPVVPPTPPAPGSYAPVSSAQAPQAAAHPGAMPPSGAPPHKSMSGAIIAGIVIAAFVGLAVLGAGGFFAWRMYAAETLQDVAAETPIPPAETTPPEPDAPVSTEPSPAAEAPGSTNGAPAGAEDGIVTDEQARWVVAQFEDARMAKDVERSRSLGSKAFLSGEWAEPLKDPTWRPDSYEIVNSVPDLMYIHVVVSERWPSGDEFWIYSVVVDPESGEPVIDGTLDPQNVPELLPK